jgi:hypothetical protein
MPTSSPRRRPINADHLRPYTAEQKLAQPIRAPTRRSLSVGRDQLVPVVQAEVGAEVPVQVYHYRLFVPIVQILWDSPTACRRLTIATKDDLETLRNLFIRDFGGVTMLEQSPSPLQGSGARDPGDPAATLEQNEHVAFEVFASATHQSDVYFSALRRELEEALCEGVILIQRLEMTLIGSLVPAPREERSRP